MELKQYLRILLKRLWIVILLPILMGGTAAYVSFYVLSPVYEANTSLFVINKKVDPQASVQYNEIVAGQYLVKDYRELIRSRAVTETVVNELKLKNLTPEGLAGMISVDSKNDTRIIEIKVRDHSPEQARRLTNKLGEVFTSKVIELMKVDNVSIIDRAKLPTVPVMPQPFMNMVIAVVIGLMLGVGAAFLLEYLDDTIKSPDDIEKHLELTVIGTIPVLNMK